MTDLSWVSCDNCGNRCHSTSPRGIEYMSVTWDDYYSVAPFDASFCPECSKIFNELMAILTAGKNITIPTTLKSIKSPENVANNDNEPHDNNMKENIIYLHKNRGDK